MTALLLTAAHPSTLSAGISPAGKATDDGCSAVTPTAVARAVTDYQAPANRRQVDGQETRRGELTGWLLHVQPAAAASLSIALPVESFIGEPVGNALIYTRDADDTGSEVHAVDLVRGCDVLLLKSPEVVRSAVLDPAGRVLYIHSVRRADRADGGVSAYDLAGGTSAIVVPPLPPSDDFGPTFGTELHWSMDGAALAVQSCGFASCRTRVFDVSTGRVATFQRPGQGAFIGLTAEALLTFADCPGLPCAVLRTELGTGDIDTLTDEAFAAELSQADGRPVLGIETAAGTLEVTP